MVNTDSMKFTVLTVFQMYRSISCAVISAIHLLSMFLRVKPDIYETLILYFPLPRL